MTDLQFRVRFYYLVVKGPYGHAMKTLEEEFKCNRLDLFNMTTQEMFISMHQEFRENCYKSRITMEVLDGKHSAPVAKGRRSGVVDGDDDSYTSVGATLTPDEAKQQHKEYKCLMCRITRKGNKKGGRGIHPTWKCPILKDCGFTLSYDYEKDSVLNPEGRQSSYPNNGRRVSQSSSSEEASSARRVQEPTPVVETVTSDEPNCWRFHYY